jgi:signal transduction histidine kinase/ligand-binding sensor domain-containing protein
MGLLSPSVLRLGRRQCARARFVALTVSFAATARGLESLLPPDLERAYTVRKWTLDDGLPDSQVCGVVPGRDGYLWLTTARHLIRFDGLHFLTVAMPAQSAVGRNEGLFQDRRGGLWVYGYFGAARYADGAWWQSEAAGMPRGRVTAVTENAEGVVYLSQENTVYAWRNGTAKPVLEASAISVAVGRFQRLGFDCDGVLWIVLGDGLFRWEPGQPAPTERATDIRAEWVLSAGADKPLLAHGSFVGLRREGGGWERLPATRPVSARCLLEFSDGSLWVGHDAGVDVLREGVWHTQTQSILYGPSRVLDMAEDREGNIWLATTEGVVRLRHRVLREVPVPGTEADKGVSVLWSEPDGGLWAGLRAGGLAAGDADGLDPLPVTPEFAGVALHALYHQTDGTLWCGGSGGSLWTLQSQVLQRVEGVYADGVKAILGNGGVPSWVATGRGLLAYNIGRGVLEELAWPLDPVLSLWLDHDGFLWVGHESLGLAVLRSGARDEFEPQTYLPGRAIRALYRDSEGVLWIGGLEGLARWEGSQRFVFRRSHGLWDESVRQIAEDACGCLWLGTAKGLMRIEKKELAEVAAGRKELLGVRTFGVEAGMAREPCTGGVCFPFGEPPRDRLWFPTSAGLLTVETRNLPPPRPAPEIRLVALELGRLATLRPAAGPVRVAPLADAASPRDVRVAYTALDFATAERVRFRHVLTGPVTLRSGLTQERHVHFSRLPPGDYAFRVTACNGDGVWHPAGASVTWTIHPFFWETVWFRLVCLVAGGGAVAATARTVERRRVRRRLEVAEREEGLSRERARIARDLHDEIGAKLTRLSLLGAMAAEDAKGDEPLCREIEEMAGTARETHRAFDEIVWSVSPRNDTVRSLAHYICKYAEEFFAGTPVFCLCLLPESMPDRTVDPRCRHQMFLAVKEGLNNALKHAAAQRVTIGVALTEGRLRVEVADDGCGFEPAARAGQGNGLRNMRERMRAVGGALLLESEKGKGTRLVFETPV